MVASIGGARSGGLSLYELYFRQLEPLSDPLQSGQAPAQGLPQLLDGMGFPPHMVADHGATTGAAGRALPMGGAGGNGTRLADLSSSRGVMSPMALGTQRAMVDEIRDLSVGELAQRLRDPNFVRTLQTLMADPRSGPTLAADRGFMERLGQALLKTQMAEDPGFRPQPGSRLAQAAGGDMGVLSDPEMAALVADLLRRRRENSGGGGPRGSAVGGGPAVPRAGTAGSSQAGATGPVAGIDPAVLRGNGDPAKGVSPEQLRAIVPNLSAERAAGLTPYLNAAMDEAGIDTVQGQATFIAQLAHESGGFRHWEEIASGAAYEGRADLGNTQPGDGRRFKGRGPLQLTGRDNYRRAGQALGIDLENNPELAARMDVGFRVAAWYFSTRGVTEAANAGNFRRATQLINGGQNGAADRERYYAQALQVLGSGSPQRA
jgi:predicted chitinase